MYTYSAYHPPNKISSFSSNSLQSFPCLFIICPCHKFLRPYPMPQPVLDIVDIEMNKINKSWPFWRFKGYLRNFAPWATIKGETWAWRAFGPCPSVTCPSSFGQSWVNDQSAKTSPGQTCSCQRQGCPGASAGLGRSAGVGAASSRQRPPAELPHPTHLPQPSARWQWPLWTGTWEQCGLGPHWKMLGLAEDRAVRWSTLSFPSAWKPGAVKGNEAELG